jgi:hypothetical protein
MTTKLVARVHKVNCDFFYYTTCALNKKIVWCLDIMNQPFNDYSPCKANRIFLTLHGSMKEVMKVGGENNYNIWHIRKDTLERQHRLPIQLNYDVALVNRAMTQITGV